MSSELDFDVEWSGYYNQGGTKIPIRFDDLRINQGKDVIGFGKNYEGNKFEVEGKYRGGKEHKIEFKTAVDQQFDIVNYRGFLEGNVIEGKRIEAGKGASDFYIKMIKPEWRGQLTLPKKGNFNFICWLESENNKFYGIGKSLKSGGKEYSNILIDGQRYNRSNAKFTFVRLDEGGFLSGQQSYSCRGKMSFHDGSMYIDGKFSQVATFGGADGTFKMKKMTREIDDKEAGRYVPPQYAEKATGVLSDEIYQRKNPGGGLFKNPRWQEIFNSGPDVLGPNVTMNKLDKDKLFTPDSEDVINIENEVNYYRNQRMRKEEEIEDLQNQKSMYIQDIQREKQAEQAEEVLEELDEQAKLKEREAMELQQRQEELLRKKNALMEQLNGQDDFGENDSVSIRSRPNEVIAGSMQNNQFIHDPLNFYQNAPQIQNTPVAHNAMPPPAPAARMTQPSQAPVSNHSYGYPHQQQQPYRQSRVQNPTPAPAPVPAPIPAQSHVLNGNQGARNPVRMQQQQPYQFYPSSGGQYHQGGRPSRVYPGGHQQYSSVAPANLGGGQYDPRRTNQSYRGYQR